MKRPKSSSSDDDVTPAVSPEAPPRMQRTVSVAPPRIADLSDRITDVYTAASVKLARMDKASTMSKKRIDEFNIESEARKQLRPGVAVRAPPPVKNSPEAVYRTPPKVVRRSPVKTVRRLPLELPGLGAAAPDSEDEDMNLLLGCETP